MTLRLAAAILIAAGSCGRPDAATAPPGASASTPAKAPAGDETQWQSKSESDEESVKPGINDRYQEDSTAKAWIERFEREGREVFDHRAEIVEKVALKAGMEVADVGAGTGIFSLLFAKDVGATGKVYAVDLQQYFLEHIAVKASEAGLSNVELVRATEKSVELPERSVDMVFMSDAYHHLEYPKTYLVTLRRAIRPGGQLVIVDLDRVEGESREWILEHVRAGKDEVVDEIEGAGFELVEELDFMKENYFLRFRRKK